MSNGRASPGLGLREGSLEAVSSVLKLSKMPPNLLGLSLTASHHNAPGKAFFPWRELSPVRSVVHI